MWHLGRSGKRGFIKKKSFLGKCPFSIPVSLGFSGIGCLMCHCGAECKWMDDAETEESHGQEKKIIKLLVC